MNILSYLKNLVILALMAFTVISTANAQSAINIKKLEIYQKANQYISCACGGASDCNERICITGEPGEDTCNSFNSIDNAKYSAKIYYKNYFGAGILKSSKDAEDSKAAYNLRLMTENDALGFKNSMKSMSMIDIAQQKMHDDIEITVKYTMADEETLAKAEQEKIFDYENEGYETIEDLYVKQDYINVAAASGAAFKENASRPRFENDYLKGVNFQFDHKKSESYTPHAICSLKYTFNRQNSYRTNALGMKHTNKDSWSVTRDVEDDFKMYITEFDVEYKQEIDPSYYNEDDNPVYNIDANFSVKDASKLRKNDPWIERHAEVVQKEFDDSAKHRASSILRMTIKEIPKLRAMADVYESEGNLTRAKAFRDKANLIMGNSQSSYDILRPYANSNNGFQDLLDSFNALKVID